MAEYIDRQAAIEALRGYFDDQILWEGIGSFVAECCEETINDIPAADVRENVKGKWELRDVTATKPGGNYYCSHCGARYDGEYYFCPNCGADMRKTCGDQEREGDDE